MQAGQSAVEEFNLADIKSKPFQGNKFQPFIHIYPEEN